MSFYVPGDWAERVRGAGRIGELRMLLLGDPGEGAVSASARESSGGGSGGGDG